MKVMTRKWMACCSLTLIWSCVFAQIVNGNEPQWIWGTTDANQSAPDGLVLFKKDFQLDQAPDSAILRITCDNQYIVRVNGRLVGVNEDWQDIEQYDITTLLHEGANSIFVQARNLSEGPAGLLVNLEISNANKESIVVNSDDTWEASVARSGTWNPASVHVRDWKKAKVLGTQAEATPWLNALSLSDTVKVTGGQASRREKLELRDGDRVLFLGNTVIEREQRYGYWEAALTARCPDKKLVFRNLGWSGDTVFGEARARFGSVADGFAHLEVHVHAVDPSLIICGYGSNAAFAGPAGLEAFIAGYDVLLNSLEATGATVVLMAPLRHEPFNGRYLKPDFNENRDLYANAIKRLAEQRGCLFFDLPQKEGQQLTDNGVHLTEFGYWATAAAIEEAFGFERENVVVRIDAEKKTADVDGATVRELEFNDGGCSFLLTRESTSLPVPREFELRLRRGDGADLERFEIPELQVTGLATGNYVVTVDDVATPKLTNAMLATGVMPSQSQGNRDLVEAIRKKNELYFHRWRPQNETYLFLFRKHEQGNNAIEIPMFDSLVADIEKKIDELKQPKAVKYVVRKQD